MYEKREKFDADHCLGFELKINCFGFIFYRPHFMDSSETLDSDDSQINLVILGSAGFAQAMESEIRVRIMSIRYMLIQRICVKTKTYV